MGQFEKTKKEILKIITERIVKECVQFYQITEARGGKAISGKLTVEEYTIRWQLEPMRKIDEESVEENPNSPVNLIAQYFAQQIPKNETTDQQKQETSIEESDLLIDYEQEKEFNEDDQSIELLNTYITEIGKIAREHIELHNIIEEFVMMYEEDLEEIGEYCKTVSQGSSENIYEYVYDFISFNAVHDIMSIHLEHKEFYKYLSDQEYRNRILNLIIHPGDSELENVDPQKIPNILVLGNTVLEGIRKKLQLSINA
jgi:hypothetical protein